MAAIGVIAVLLTVVGCRPPARQLDVNALARSGPRRLLLVLKEASLVGPAGPVPNLGWPSGGGMVGAAQNKLATDISMSREGEQIMKRNRIADPSFAIGRDLARRLSDRHRLTWSELRETPPPNAEAAYSPRPPWPATDLALQVRTVSWAIENQAPNVRPVVRFTAEARLTDRRTGAVLARGQCVADDGEAARPVTDRYYELFVGTPTALERELDRLSQICLRRFAELLSLP